MTNSGSEIFIGLLYTNNAMNLKYPLYNLRLMINIYIYFILDTDFFLSDSPYRPRKNNWKTIPWSDSLRNVHFFLPFQLTRPELTGPNLAN